MTQQSSVELVGTAEWAWGEPEWVGTSDEVSEYFELLTATAGRARYMWEDQSEQMAKWAWQLQLDSVVWIYFEHDEDPERWGLPSREQAADWLEENYPDLTENLDYGSPSANAFGTWAYLKVDDVRRELWWAEEEKRRLEKRMNELNNRSK